LVGHRRRQ